MAHFVFVVPPEGDVSAAAKAVAAATGREAIDVRQALLKGAPLVVAWTSGEPEAAALRSRLLSAGVEAFAFPEEVLAALPEPLEARTFALERDAFVARDRAGAEVRLAYAEIALIVRARSEATTHTVTETTSRSLSKAGLAFGVPISKKTTSSSASDSVRIEPFALAYRLDPPAAVRLAREALDYRGLGEGLGPASLTNFAELLRRLETACPGARRDSRLDRAAGKIAGVPAEARRSFRREGRGITVSQRSTSSDNAEAIAFAAGLLFLAERERRRR